LKRDRNSVRRGREAALAKKGHLSKYLKKSVIGKRKRKGGSGRKNTKCKRIKGGTRREVRHQVFPRGKRPINYERKDTKWKGK